MYSRQPEPYHAALPICSGRLVGQPEVKTEVVPANLIPKNATSCTQAQCSRVDHNLDRVPDSRPCIASGRANSIDCKWAVSGRHSRASIHLRLLQPVAPSTTRYGTG